MIELLRIGLANAAFATVLAVVVFAVTRLWREPQLAHVLWLLVLVKLVTPPIVAVPFPGWFDWSAAPHGVIADAQSTAASPLPSVDLANAEYATSLPLIEETPADPRPSDSAPIAEHSVPLPSPAPVSTKSNAVVRSSAVDWRQLAARVWIAGSLGVLVLGACRIRRFARFVSETEPASDEIQADVRELADRLGLRNVPGVRIVRGTIPPVVWSLGRRPVILLPARLLDRLDRVSRRTIVAHELAHIRRRDHVVRWLEALVVALYWWNPIVWLARRELHAAEEQCCDACVARLVPGNAREYAAAIVETVEFLSTKSIPLPAGASGMHRSFPLKRRVAMILENSAPRRMSWKAGLVASAFALVVLPLSLATFPDEKKPDRPAGAADDDRRAALADHQLRPPQVVQLADDVQAAAQPVEPDSKDGLREGWLWRVTIPEILFMGSVYAPESRVKLWVEKGWLVVRHSTLDDEVEWQVVLARASDPNRPTVKFDETTGALEIAYRNHIIRDNKQGLFRVNREAKTEQSPEWPMLVLEPWEHQKMTLGSQLLYYRELDYWRWLIGGPSEDRPDIWVRFRPTARNRRLPNPFSTGGLVTIGGNEVMEAFEGQSRALFERDLVIVSRLTVRLAERQSPLSGVPLGVQMGILPAPPGENGGRAAPAGNLDGLAPAFTEGTLLNSNGPLVLDKLHGKVPLLYFWAAWCPPSVKYLAAIEELHKKYAAKGLVVIGIHAAHKSEGALAAMKEHGVTFPVMIDTGAMTVEDYVPGETAKRYGVEVLPNGFLIDKSGKPTWGYGMAPPAESQIVGLLLNGEPAPPLAAGEWLNTGEPVTLDGLKGKVVVLTFWNSALTGTFPAAARIFPQIETLRANGTTVIGVYRPADGENVEKMLNDKVIRFPVLVDSGDTARRYSADAATRAAIYVVIDKTGKIASWSTAPPAKPAIDALSK